MRRIRGRDGTFAITCGTSASQAMMTAIGFVMCTRGRAILNRGTSSGHRPQTRQRVLLGRYLGWLAAEDGHDFAGPGRSDTRRSLVIADPVPALRPRTSRAT
jgi:hypothetical protein